MKFDKEFIKEANRVFVRETKRGTSTVKMLEILEDLMMEYGYEPDYMQELLEVLNNVKVK